MIKRIGKVIVINVIILIVFFGLAELIFRVAFPEFTNDIHGKNYTVGKKSHASKLYGIDVRVQFEGENIDIKPDTPLLIIVGDSITNGFGHNYEEMYQHRLERLLNINSKIQIISLAGAGNELFDSTKNLHDLLSKSNRKSNIKYIVYQFNFNDITPFGSSALQEGEHLHGIQHTNIFKAVAMWRYQYFNKSTFFRVMQHYASKIMHKLHGSCEQRGYDALDQYTWTFGCRPFKSQSEELWQEFDKLIGETKKYADGISAKFVIFVSPILYDIDEHGVHSYYNPYNLDFSCATINPRARLAEIGRKYNIDIVDPKDYVKSHFENLVREGNFTPFYFPADSNHFTPAASGYVAEYLYQYFSKQKD